MDDIEHSTTLFIRKFTSRNFEYCATGTLRDAEKPATSVFLPSNADYALDPTQSDFMIARKPDRRGSRPLAGSLFI